MAGATVAVQLNMDAECRLAYSTDSGLASPSFTSPVTTQNRRAKLTVTGLTAGTTYYYAVELNGTIDTGLTGTFKTLDSTDTTFLVAFSGDADSGSNHAVFDSIRLAAPDLFIHLGDLHDDDIATGTPYLFHGAYDEVFAQSKQSELYRKIPTVYTWDDHDFGGDNSFGTDVVNPIATKAYRRRVPHYTLEESSATGGIYHSFEVSVGGLGVIFVVTDQRSASSDPAATDNSSKTMLGTTQKTWFKGLFSNAANDSKLFVWCCARLWGGVATAGADHWGGYTTERTELGGHINTEAPGRVIVLSADAHYLAIDDGTNHTFGSEPFPTFQAAPLDQIATAGYGGPPTFSEGAEVYALGQYGTMLITKTGASQLTVDWTGKLHDGSTLVTHQMVFNL